MAGRQGFCQEDQMIKGMLPCSSSSSTSSPSSSSTSHYNKGLVPPTDGRWDAQIYDKQHYSPWGWQLGSKLEPQPAEEREEEGSGRCSCEGAAAAAVRRGGDSEGAGSIQREHMFDKVVTPSDVGKLNRLVIPKQHAEKYFPLDSSTNEKGLLLNFEDPSGKPWRFRYSYWNSSQSYVMTKGWSRFVKEKKLDAGDIVSFQRGVGELGKDRLYIDWRRRPDAPEPTVSPLPSLSLPHHYFSFRRSFPWTPMLLRPPPVAASSPWDHAHLPQQPINNVGHHRNTTYGGGGSYDYNNNNNNNNLVNPCSGSSVFYLRSTAPQQVGMVRVQQSGAEPISEVFDSVPVVHGKAAAKRLRLFGVNMECPISASDECDILSSTTIPHATISSHSSHLSSSSFHPLHLSLYKGTPLPTMPTHLLDKGKASTSFDFDISEK